MRFLNTLFLLVCAAFLTSQIARAADCDPSRTQAKYPALKGRTLKIGVDPQQPPYVMVDLKNPNNLVGIDVDFAKATFDCAGIKYEFVRGAWSGLLPALQGGQVDIMWDNLYYRPARAEVINFVMYMRAATGTLVPAANPKKLSKLEDLCGLTTTYPVSSTNEAISVKQSEACKAAGKAEITGMPYTDISAGLRLVSSERADALLMDLGVVDALVADNSDKYTRAFLTTVGLEIGVGVRKTDEELLNLILETVQSLQATGVQKTILQKYKIEASLEIPAAIKTK